MCPNDVFKMDRDDFLLPLKRLQSDLPKAVEEGGHMEVDGDFEGGLETVKGLDELGSLVQQDLCCELQKADKELSDLLPAHILQKISFPKVTDLTDEGICVEDNDSEFRKSGMERCFQPPFNLWGDPEAQEDLEEDVALPFPETFSPISQNFLRVDENDETLDALQKLQLPQFPSISRNSTKLAKINLGERLLAAKKGAKVAETLDPAVCCAETPPPSLSSSNKYVFHPSTVIVFVQSSVFFFVRLFKKGPKHANDPMFFCSPVLADEEGA